MERLHPSSKKFLQKCAAKFDACQSDVRLGFHLGTTFEDAAAASVLVEMVRAFGYKVRKLDFQMYVSADVADVLVEVFRACPNATNVMFPGGNFSDETLANMVRAVPNKVISVNAWRREHRPWPTTARAVADLVARAPNLRTIRLDRVLFADDERAAIIDALWQFPRAHLPRMGINKSFVFVGFEINGGVGPETTDAYERVANHYPSSCPELMLFLVPIPYNADMLQDLLRFGEIATRNLALNPFQLFHGVPDIDMPKFSSLYNRQQAYAAVVAMHGAFSPRAREEGQVTRSSTKRFQEENKRKRTLQKFLARDGDYACQVKTMRFLFG